MILIQHIWLWWTLFQTSTEFVLPQTTLNIPLFFPAWQSSQDCLNLILSTLCAVDYGLSWFTLSNWTIFRCNLSFPGGSVIKNPPANAGDEGEVGWIPGLGRSLLGGNGNPLQYSYLKNSMDRGIWWTTVHEVAKSQTWLSMHTSLHTRYNLLPILRPKISFLSEFSQGNIWHSCE